MRPALPMQTGTAAAERKQGKDVNGTNINNGMAEGRVCVCVCVWVWVCVYVRAYV